MKMFKRFSPFFLLFLTTALQAQGLQGFSANYRLSFDGKTMGQALFHLEITEDGHYSFDVYTVPEGEMAAKRPGHEILESSTGRLKHGYPVPEHYYYSVRDKDKTELLNMLFQWPEKQVVIRSGTETKTEKLISDSQDRLSYLLYAMSIATGDQQARKFTLFNGKKAETTVLQVTGAGDVEVPMGKMPSLKLERTHIDNVPDRILWLSTGEHKVLTLLENPTPEGLVRMELIQLKPSS